jgi:hypothetical protein
MRLTGGGFVTERASTGREDYDKGKPMLLMIAAWLQGKFIREPGPAASPESLIYTFGDLIKPLVLFLR